MHRVNVLISGVIQIRYGIIKTFSGVLRRWYWLFADELVKSDCVIEECIKHIKKRLGLRLCDPVLGYSPLYVSLYNFTVNL
jgi:hypothetical protein